MNLVLYILSMLIIMAGTIAYSQLSVALFAFVLLVAGVFIYRFQDHPAVREWVEKYF